MTEAQLDPEFRIDVHQNRYQATAPGEMHAIVSVGAHGLGRAARGTGPAAAEIILVDMSGSMDNPPEKMRAAVRATAVAIAAVRDGVHFAVVGGNHKTAMVYPELPGLAVASADTRAAATAELARLVPVGGTTIGSWLTTANELFDGYPAMVRHALMFTDGRNEHEERAHLDEVLAACHGRFTCDARGIGADWEPDELDRIVSVLNGGYDAVRGYDDLADDFGALMHQAMGRVVPDVSLRLTTMVGATLRYVKQVKPTVAELTATPARAGGWDLHTGSWADELRQYHVCLAVDPTDRPRNEDTVAARIELVLGQPGSVTLPELPATILLHWTDDPVLLTRFDPTVDGFTGQQAAGDAARAGGLALAAGDETLAVAELGRAVRLATESGNTLLLDRLAELVQIVDARRGEVRLRPQRDRIDFLRLMAGSRFTTSDDEPVAAPRYSAWPGGPCPHCQVPTEAGHSFCGACGKALDHG
jgi:Mg-chelatase subunit ChlD